MSLGGQNFIPQILGGPGLKPQTSFVPDLYAGSIGKGGSLPPETLDAIQMYIASQPAVIEAFNNSGRVVDPSVLAQQAILARPVRPSFTGQQLMSREVPVGLQGNSGLAYPSMQQSGLLQVPSYTSRYAGTDSGGGSGGGIAADGYSGAATYGSNNSLSNGLVGAMLGLSSQPSFDVAVDNMGTYSGMPDYGYGSPMTGVGNPGESYGGYTSSDTGVGNPGESAVGGNTSSDTGAGNPGESE